MSMMSVLYAILFTLSCIVFTNVPAQAGELFTGSDGRSVADSQGGGATVIDVMILYTPEAAQYASEGIQNRINQALAEGNQALLDSNVPVALNLVYSGEYAGIRDSGNKRCNVEYYLELMNNAEVQNLRVQYGADLVQLVVRDIADNCWGAAENWGSIVKAERLLAPNYTMIHEFAHSIGEPHVPAGFEDMHKTADPCVYPRLCSIMGKYVFVNRIGNHLTLEKGTTLSVWL